GLPCVRWLQPRMASPRGEGTFTGARARLVVCLGVLALFAVAAPVDTAVGAPANDNFPGTTLSGLPTSATGTNVGASSESGEPNHAGVTGGASVWYSWTAPSSGPVVVDTCGSNFNTLLGVYTGATVNALSEVASNNDAHGCSFGSYQSMVSFSA